MTRRPNKNSDDLRQRILEHSETLRFLLSSDDLDEILRRAEKERPPVAKARPRSTYM